MPYLFRTVLYLTVSLTAVTGRASAQTATCAAAFTDSLSQRTLQAFARVALVQEIWDDYSLARHPLLLVADSTFRGSPDAPVCAAIWRKDQPLERLALAARPPMSTPLYGMVSTEPVGARPTNPQLAIRPLPASVALALGAAGITRTLVLQVPLDFGTLGRLGEMLRTARADPALILADLAVHESFHLHAQFPTWLDQARSYAWPEWDVQPDRAAFRQHCYAGASEVTAALDAERTALLAAFDALYGATRDSAAAVRHTRRFVDLRLTRRAMQDTIRIAHGASRVPCGEAEDILELEEGTVQWIGHATTVTAGLTTLASLRGNYGGTQAERFYQTGPLQWWILDGLLGRDAVRRLTTAVARSARGDLMSSVFSILTQQLR